MTDEPELTNDDIVGRALKLSIAGIVLAAILGTAFLFLQRGDEEQLAEKTEQTALPEVRQLPPLEIPAIPFTDVSGDAGLRFVHQNGAAGEKLLPETMGGGGAFFDFDNDGDQDIVCVNSTIWPWSPQSAESPTQALYENDGTGRFTDITAGSGLDVSFYGNGVACGDYDNDGLVDLYFTAVGPGRLFHNEGGGKFRNVTSDAAVAGAENAWSTSAGFFDYDLDGDLDLFVCHYIEWTRDTDLAFEFTLDGTLRAYGRPADFRGAFPILYRNDGDGRFTDISEESGIRVTNPNTGEPLAKSLGLTFSDVNSDGRPDVIIANDTVQNLLLLNQPDGTFTESGAGCGIAFDSDGTTRGAMGIDAACFRNTESLGITIGNFANEMTALYVCQTPGMELPIFRDEAVSNGIGPVTRVELTFGVLFLDADLDGRLDIFACNGHLEEDIQKVQSSQHYEQPPQLLWNCGSEYENEFMVVPEDKVGADFLRPMVGRGATSADIDGDGDLDLLLFASGGPARLLRNDQQSGHHWLRFKLTGAKSNRDAIGATVKVTLPDDTVLTRTVNPTRSYQSQVELPVTFGLGDFETVKSVAVTWPTGNLQSVAVDAVDRLIDVQE
ncbi:MAG: CRTAC1 family protein [Planctomycetaceae bacterium]